MDSGGLKVNDALFICVSDSGAGGAAPVDFSVTVDLDYDAFMASAQLKARLVETIAAVRTR